MGFFGEDCDHDWEIVTDKTLESPAEQVNLGKRAGASGVPAWIFSKKSITILKCTKCGKLDKTIEHFKP